MQEIQTASWIETSKFRGIDVAMVYHHWLRMDPPALAVRYAIGDSWTHSLRNEQGSHLAGAASTHVKFDPEGRLVSREQLLENVIFLPESGGAPWSRETTVEDGSAQFVYRRHFSVEDRRVDKLVCTESATNRILRKIHYQTDLTTGTQMNEMIADRYAYNVDIPEDIFSMPPDLPVEALPALPTRTPWDSCPERERTAIQAVIDPSDEGWPNADFDRFASVWSLESSALVPREWEWRARVASQAGLWRAWHSIPESVSERNALPVAVSAQTWRFAPERQKVIHVAVTIHVEAQDTGASREYPGAFYLRHAGHGYRIVHWEPV